MIALVIFALVVLLLAATPWRRLPRVGRLWAMAALLNVIVFLTMPTTPATSPWRPIVTGVPVTSAGASLVLVAVGLVLRQRHAPVGEAGPAWVGPLIPGTLPGLLYTLLWIFGPRS